jgi:hypothetical protein
LALAAPCGCVMARFVGKPWEDAAEPDRVTFGEVVAVHIDKAFIRDGVYDTALARPIARAGRRGDYFEMTPETMFEMVRPD